MAKIKKTLSEKETILNDIINDAKRKLSKLQVKQKMDLGDLACNHGLNLFDLTVVDSEFKKLAEQLSRRN